MAKSAPTSPAAADDGIERGRIRLLLAAATVLVARWMPQPAAAADGSGITLIMVDEPGCQYCRKFDADIGRGYPRTAVGAFAPLVRVRRKSGVLAAFNPVIYTPTFILTRRGEEIGRITGYPGPEYFYSELGELLAKAGYSRAVTDRTSAT